MEGPLPLNRLPAPLHSSNAVLRARSRVHFVENFPGRMPWPRLCSPTACSRARLGMRI
jgi:hypothetical protein